MKELQAERKNNHGVLFGRSEEVVFFYPDPSHSLSVGSYIDLKEKNKSEALATIALKFGNL